VETCSDFWGALAPFHADVEDTNFDIASVRRLMPEIQSPVLVVGAGHGLIVAELRKNRFDCDGIDLDAEMIRQAKLRRGIELVQADARAMPFAEDSYQTIIYATGVVDFTADENAILAMLTEGQRLIRESGKIFVAFYKTSPLQERFLVKVNLLRDGKMALRQSLELYQLNPVQMIGWVARRAGVTHFSALMTMIHLAVRCTTHERKATLKMQRVFRKIQQPQSLINAAPLELPYRDEKGIESLFKRLGIPIKCFSRFSSCCVVQI
jgi:SAM-dependent methyltransferase